MLPIRNPYLSALVEIERRLLFCESVHACYTNVIERVGFASGASHACVVEFDIAAVHEVEQDCAHASEPIVRAGATWSAAAADSLNWAAILADPALDSWLMRLRQGEALQKTQVDFSVTEQQLLAPYGVCAVLMLPLVVHQHVQGAIAIIYQAHPHSWEPMELEIWQGVALVLGAKLEQLQTQASIATDPQPAQPATLEPITLQPVTHSTAVIQEQTQRLQKMLEFEALLRRITDRVRDSLDEAQILQTAVQELAIGLETYSCDAGRYDWEQGTSTIAYEFLRSPQIPTAQGLVFCLSDHLDIYSQLLQGRYLQFCWIVSPVHPRTLNQPFSVLCCPIMDDQTVIGDIWLYKQADTYFEIEAVRLVEQVANQCAIAIRQARLYQAAQAQVHELERLNYLKDEFLNTVSHELRSPMANIEMAIQMLELLLFQDQRAKISDAASNDLKATTECCTADCSNTPIRRSPERHPTEYSSTDANPLPHPTSFQQSIRYFRMLQDECMRETNLINDLLDLSRLEAGTEPIVLTTISLQAWIPHIIEPFLERARSQCQQLRVQVSDTVPLVALDLRSLERILTELVHNACKYTPTGEEIRVVVNYIPSRIAADSKPDRSKTSCLTSVLDSCPPASSPQLTVQVSNSGVEIPAAELPRIFDKFYRVPSSDLWRHEGTGLGLALVKRLAEHLGAKIWVDSGNNQVTFSLMLPLEPPAPSAE
jgi:signal transduction histidine kinase